MAVKRPDIEMRKSAGGSKTQAPEMVKKKTKGKKKKNPGKNGY